MTLELRVIDIVGTPFCVAVEDGHKVYGHIARQFEKREAISLSFSGVTRLTTAFLNAAIGQAYNEFSDETIRALLRVTDMDEKGLSLLKKAVDHAKLFYASRRKSGG